MKIINKKRRSFFSRMTEPVHFEDPADAFDDEVMMPAEKIASSKSIPTPHNDELEEDSAGMGQLPIDLHQTTSEFVLRAFVAGVRPDELSISISRDMVEIEGSRMEREQVSEEDFFSRELFWGSFSRVIQLPEEVDVENSAATAKDGLLTIVLPKLDKAKQTKLRVKAG